MPDFDDSHEALIRRWYAVRDEGLLVLVLYERPLDYPGWYVVRAQRVTVEKVCPVDGVALFREQAKARGWIEQCFPGLAHVARDPADEPQIVGSWL